MIEEILNSNIINKHSLIFDLDGALVNTDEVNFFAYKEAIRQIRGLDLALFYDNNERFTREKLYPIIGNLSDQEYESIIEIKNNVYHKYLSRSTVNDCVLKVIEKFSCTNQVILATSSHKNRANTVLMYQNLVNLFDHKFYKEDYKNNNKFKYVLEYFNLDPSLVMIFENDSNEIKKAVLSGVPNKNIVNTSNIKGTI